MVQVRSGILFKAYLGQTMDKKDASFNHGNSVH